MPSNYSFIDTMIAGSAIPYSIDDLEQYVDDGISHIISLTPKLPLVSKYNTYESLKFHHFPVYASPDTFQLREFISLMNEITKKREKAVVHCQYGQERTGIFLACYLVEIKGMKIMDAIKVIQDKREGSLQTQHAIQFLKSRYL